MVESEPDDDSLDAAMAAGYGAERGSVLEAVGRAGGQVTRVLLPDNAAVPGIAPTSPEPEVRGRLPKGRGNYLLRREIARGGMGVVLEGHDVDLCRDVAVKVLHRELASRPETLHRFIEEAQIGGQLQHPGVVPVHELGLTPDELPYFTMKLIRGRTLAALLAERPALETGRRGLLDIFSTVCQTIAYAHSRGVIHRDLKPANVMVGAFGEVHVVDWGLSKVLKVSRPGNASTSSEVSKLETVRSGSGSSASMAGAVLGTPAYMPPEQARGLVDELDERADVFSLGAILCEILSGTPPYGGGREDALMAASRGDLAGAFRRLRSSGADRELIALCEECLCTDRDSRPRGAEVVAKRLHDYLVSVEDRARAAQIEAAEARVRALEERRARRLTAALATSVLVIVIGLGGGWAWLAARRAGRAREIAGGVDAALADATLARGRRDWNAASAAIERAGALVDAPEAEAGLHERVSALRDQIEDEIAGEARAKQREERNRALLDRLDLIRYLDRAEEVLVDGGVARRVSTSSGASDPGGHRHKDAAYVEAFATLGIDEECSEESAVDAIRATGVASEIALALDAWASVRERLDLDRRSERAQRLRRIAMDADDNEWRRAVRLAVVAGEDRALLELSAAIPENELDPLTTVSLCRALIGAQRTDEAGGLLLAAHRRHRDDFALTHEVANYHWMAAQHLSSSAAQPQYREALRYYTAAAGLRPESVSTLNSLGMTELNLGEFTSAAASFGRATEIDPDFDRAHAGLCWSLMELGRFDEAVEAGRRAVALGPALPWAYDGLGVALGKKGELAEAEEICRVAIELEPGTASAHVNLGNVLFDRGEVDAAIEAYRQAIVLDPVDSKAYYNLGRAQGSRGDLESAIHSYRRATEVNPGDPAPHHNMGAAHRERGELDAAIECYRRATELAPTIAISHATLGSALREKGELEAALESLRRSLQLDSRFTYAHYELGVALADRGDLAGAIASFERALAVDPRYPHALCSLSIVWRQMGELDRAVDAGRRGIAGAEVEGSCHAALGKALLAKHETREALELLRAAVDRFPMDPDALAGLAWTLATCEPADLREPSEAVSFARGAVELAAEDGDAWTALGVALYRSGDLEGSVEALTRASDLHATGEAADWLFLAMAEHRRDRPDLARAWLERSTSWLDAHPHRKLEAASVLQEARSVLDTTEGE